MNDEANQRTLESYDAAPDVYEQRTPPTVEGSFKAWIDKALSLLQPRATVMEIGTGTGRDAAYMELAGFRVTRTEASAGLLDRMRSSGLEVEKLDILTDPVEGRYDMVFANAVFHHFTETQLSDVLLKASTVLEPGGILAFSVKAGDGEVWESEKLGLPRYFRRWTAEGMEVLLRDVGLEIVDVEAGATSESGEAWVQVIARAAR